MKKVEIETECGEVSTIYVSQDVTKVTVDGEEYNPIEIEDEEKETPVAVEFHTKDDGIMAYGARNAFVATFSNGIKIYANSDGRVEILGRESSNWTILHPK